MLFASTTFVFLFLPAVLIIYHGLLRKSLPLKNLFLTIVSLLFYAWGEPKFVLVMLLSIAANWFFGLLVAKFMETKKNVAKLAVGASVVFNLLTLFIFKYLSFSVSVVSEIFGLSLNMAKIALPIGISFFTFQAMSYVIDVYRRHGTYQKNIMNVGLYVACFPQLIAGPIVRYETVAYEIENRKETADDFFDGFARFVVGMAKKVLIANNLALCADNAFGAVSELTVAASWLGAICYAFQIFFDFCGYSDMAIGLGKMFGFHYLENFDYPYISRSITEFWRRWHISLGTWFRDYVYIPLGGNRVSKSRMIFNLFVVWLLTGIWHGANWTFVIWGLMYFVLLLVEKLTGLYKYGGGKLGSILKWGYTMFFVLMGWVLFRADSLAQAWLYIRTMFGFAGRPVADHLFLLELKNVWVFLVAAVVFSVPIAAFVRKRIDQTKVMPQILYRVVLVILFIAVLASIVSSAHNPFIYFNF